MSKTCGCSYSTECGNFADWTEDCTDSSKSLVSETLNITGMNDDQFRKRLSFMWIYFDKLETTEITQTPSMTLTSLIENSGGLLGESHSLTCSFFDATVFFHFGFYQIPFKKVCS